MYPECPALSRGCGIFCILARNLDFFLSKSLKFYFFSCGQWGQAPVDNHPIGENPVDLLLIHVEKPTPFRNRTNTRYSVPFFSAAGSSPGIRAQKSRSRKPAAALYLTFSLPDRSHSKPAGKAPAHGFESSFQLPSSGRS